MPEGPEIRLAADRIARVLEGERLHEVFLAPRALRRFEPRLEGATVTRVDTRGKAMLTRFDNGLTLYSHNQLYGRWYVRARGELPRTRRSLRVAFHTALHSALLYSATDIEVLDAAGLEVHAFLSRLGPDILDPELSWQALGSRLNEPRFRARSLASLYLDQAFLAGIGNYLRSEILYFAGIPSHAQACGHEPRGSSTPCASDIGRRPTFLSDRRHYESVGTGPHSEGGRRHKQERTPLRSVRSRRRPLRRLRRNDPAGRCRFATDLLLPELPGVTTCRIVARVYERNLNRDERSASHGHQRLSEHRPAPSAEKLVFGQLSTGAADALSKATDIARNMALCHGIDEDLGDVTYEEDKSDFLSPGGGYPQREHSEETAREIDSALKTIIGDLFDGAYAVLETNREVLDACARTLFERETLDEAEFVELTRGLEAPARKAKC